MDGRARRVVPPRGWREIAATGGSRLVMVWDACTARDACTAWAADRVAACNARPGPGAGTDRGRSHRADRAEAGETAAVRRAMAAPGPVPEEEDDPDGACWDEFGRTLRLSARFPIDAVETTRAAGGAPTIRQARDPRSPAREPAASGGIGR